MAIVRWEPFRDLVTTQDRFNRLFNDTFARAFGNEEPSARAWMPPVDIYETEDKLVLKAELPGMDPNEVEVPRGRQHSLPEGRAKVRKRSQRGKSASC